MKDVNCEQKLRTPDYSKLINTFPCPVTFNLKSTLQARCTKLFQKPVEDLLTRSIAIMKPYILIAALFFGTVLTQSNEDPAEDSAQPELTEGDMILTEEQKQILFFGSDKRNGVTNPSLRWPNGVVFYQFTGNIPNNHRNLIINSLREIERSTCVRFRQGSNGNRYIRITNNAAGCFAYVGYLKSAQQLNLGNGCMHKGVIIHEFLHAIGFYHQQSSADRDSFVNIHLENVQSGQEHNFNKYSSSQVTNFGIRYDYGSIMHYGPYAFSKNNRPTITAKFSGGENMGQSNGLSQSDILKIRRITMKSHFIVSLLAAIAFAQPIDEVKKGDGPKPPKKPWPTDIPDLTEGDMILTAEQKDFLFSETRNGVTDTRLRWPGAFVYFWFDSNFSNDERNLVISALIEIQKYTCVRFVMGANSENHYIRVTKSSSGCFAYVGYLRAAQQLNLGNGCMHFGIIIHEFLHALGFYHEQSTYNRDDYVYIHLENVISGQEHNFNKYTNHKYPTLELDMITVASCIMEPIRSVKMDGLLLLPSTVVDKIWANGMA
uniref:Metalloendopeptidase n=1 Tax=Megaselia scalaris TaxID=36166 RepID=T1GM43_MEGSC